MAEDREQAIEEIVQSARAARPRTPRWLWLVGGALGIAGAIAFVLILVGQGDATSGPAPVAGPPDVDGGRSFGAGLALGVGLGIAIGFAIARQVLRDHSSRKSP